MREVEVTIRAEVKWENEKCIEFSTKDGSWAGTIVKNAAKIVEIFHNCVVRRIATGCRYTLDNEGYLSHQTGNFFKWDQTIPCDHFASENYVKVEV